MVVGQSLCGKPCIESQIPFTGGSGLILDEVFTKAGIQKRDIYITNIVKCDPPGNRQSFRHEVENCKKFFQKEIAWLDPKTIICLGKDAWHSFDLQISIPSSKKIEGREVVFYYHPGNRKPAEQVEHNIQRQVHATTNQWQLRDVPGPDIMWRGCQ